jgi:hypothetical protein
MGEGEKRATARRARDEKGLHLLLESRARDEHEVYDREDQRDEEEVAHRFPERVPVADALAHALNTLLVVGLSLRRTCVEIKQCVGCTR